MNLKTFAFKWSHVSTPIVQFARKAWRHASLQIFAAMVLGGILLYSILTAR